MPKREPWDHVSFDAPTMHLTSLNLQNYRNISELDLQVPQGLTVLFGGNAQGKSNLLEAIYLFASARAVRANHDRELIGWSTLEDALPFARARITVSRVAGAVNMEIVVQLSAPLTANRSTGTAQSPQQHKRIRVNGVVKRASEALGEVNAVLFTPQDIELVHGPASIRRRYLDMTLSQVDRPLLVELQRYSRVLAQRNHLLKSIREGRARREELPFWDRELIGAGSFIMARRVKALEALNRLASSVHNELTGGAERLELRYQPSIVPTPESPEISAAFEKALAAAAQRELQQAISLVGPHRDDLHFTTNGRELRVYGSRGQQRTASLALKIAEAQFMAERAGDEPILLLDDVFSELDPTRRGYLLSRVSAAGQAILTTADPEAIDLELIPNATIMRITDGRVTANAVPTYGQASTDEAQC